MKLLKTLLLGSILLTTHFYAISQSEGMGNAPNYDNYSQFCAILHDGLPIAERWNTDQELILSPDMKGVLSVSTIDRSGNKFEPLKKVGIRLGIFLMA